MKHAEHIVAFDKARFGSLVSGFNHMMIQQFLAQAQRSLVVSRRAELEGDESFGQLLPYVVLYSKDPEGKLRYFTYQRGKGVGESRLAGNFSIGIGGHVDLEDVQSKNSVVDVLGTINNAMAREIEEEIRFSDGLGNEIKPQLKPVFFGVINDSRDPVGRVHYGALYGIKVPHDILVECREAELLTIGMMDRDQLSALHTTTGSKLEGWSEIVAREYREFEELASIV
jgi:predicted NUDIX family phosphoesterase